MSDVFAYRLGEALYLNITNRCTFRCTFCVRNSGDSFNGSDLWLRHEPDADEVIAAIEAMGGADGFREVVFCGYGEPTMRLEVLLETARRIRARWCVPVRLNTNGQANLVYGRDVTPELREAVDAVSISLNAPTAQEYAALCRPEHGEAAFQAMLGFAAACRRQGISTVMTVVDVIGPEKVEQCRRIAEDLGVGFRVRAYIE